MINPPDTAVADLVRCNLFRKLSISLSEPIQLMLVVAKGAGCGTGNHPQNGLPVTGFK